MRNEFEVAFNEIAELRALPSEVVLEALRTALISAYRRDSGASAAQEVDAMVDPGTGRARIFVEKEVVDEVFNAKTEVDLEKARYYHPEAQLGETVMVQVEGTTKKFGRIAAQTAKQVILQKIREAERNALYDEFKDKEGDIINATVQSINAAVATLSLGRAEAILPRAQQIPGERYRPHDKVRVYLLEVKRTNRGPQIVTSRSNRNMLRRLLEFEVPEIYNGQVEIKNIAREAGHRSKVAVSALQEGIDPVGACVGMRGIRIQNIVKELHDEKIDIIEWNSDQELFIAKALSPARVIGVYLDDDPDGGRTAVVIVPDEDLSLAIGREGQNARLAAKLTGWRIDIKSVTEAVQSALDNLDSLEVADVVTKNPEVVEEVSYIMDKKANNMAVMPEEFKTLAKFADLVEDRILAEKMEARKARIAEINAVRATLPSEAFEIPVQRLLLPDRILESLEPMGSVGEIMLRFLIDEERLRRLLGKEADNALQQVQDSLDSIMMPDTDLSELIEVDEESVDVEEEVGVIEESVETPVEDSVSEEIVDDQPDVVPAIGAFPVVDDGKPRRKKSAKAEKAEEAIDDEEYLDDNDPEKLDQKSKKDRQKRRQLIFDEDTGETIARRRRKGGRKTDDWGTDF